MTRSEDLVVLSHLRWTWVWQRPQHLVSRLATGRRTWFVEEPLPGPVHEPRLNVRDDGPVRRVWLEIPGADDWYPFDHESAACYGDALAALVGAEPAVTWLYTPMALPMARRLGGDVLVYDVMDDLASFARAPAGMRRLQREALAEADLVFTGGRSLYRAVRDAAPERTHLFPSGVEPEHYAAARARRAPHERPVAGYVGVVDERLDLSLIAGLARELPDWDLEIVGPVAKIDPADLPQAGNIRYTGMQPYERLPDVMAGFDVALMPFALNEATRSISPTKTLEYLAAGLPVVSTPVPDVVADYARIVALATDAPSFAAACRRVQRDGVEERDATSRPLLHEYHWDTIAARMEALVDGVRLGLPEETRA